jgi:Flp pilus assembly protein TadD
LYQQQEQYKEAAQAFENVLRLDKDNPEAHINLGVVYTALLKLKQAEEQYQAALVLDPRLSEAHYNLGLLYEFHHNAPEKALEYYKEYVKLGGQDERIAKLLKKVGS